MILKATEWVGLPNFSGWVCVCVCDRVNIHTCTDWFTGQLFLLKMVCSHRLMLFVSVNSVSTRGWFGFRDSVGAEFLFNQVAFSYPLNKHQDFRI